MSEVFRTVSVRNDAGHWLTLNTEEASFLVAISDACGMDHPGGRGDVGDVEFNVTADGVEVTTEGAEAFLVTREDVEGVRALLDEWSAL